MNIFELQLQLQPATPPEVRGQCAIEIKAAIFNIESMFQECIQVFEDIMDVQASLQEDPDVQKIEVEICEKLEQMDHIKVTMKILAPVLWYTHLQEGKFLQGKIDELRIKEQIITTIK